MIGPPNERYAAIRDVDFNDTQLQDIAPTFELLWNWANLANEFSFGYASTGIREQKIWRGAPSRNGGANVYDQENLRPADPRNLSTIKITPVIVEACVYYNLGDLPTRKWFRARARSSSLSLSANRTLEPLQCRNASR